MPKEELYFIAQLGCDCDGIYPSSQIAEVNLPLEEAQKICESHAEWSDGILYTPKKMSEIKDYQ